MFTRRSCILKFISLFLHSGIIMGKYDHIPELLGSENYIRWSTKMQYTLTYEDLWCHINTVMDPADLLGTPSTLPVPADPANTMAAERTEMCEWLLNDMKAKDLITRRLSPSVGSLVSHSHTVLVSYPIHSHFSSEVPDVRSDQIQSTDLYRIHHDKLLHSYPVHITLNTAYFLHLVYPPFRYIGYAFFWLCLLIRFTCDYLPAYD